jgi:hypothetical protein
MALIDVGIVAAKPNAADRKPAVSLAFRYTGLLKQQKGATARADKTNLLVTNR